MKKLTGMLVLCAASLAFGTAHGHGNPVANHGGVVQAVGETWLELVVKGDSVEMYLEDDGDPMESAGVSGKVTIGGKEVILAPAGGNKLQGKVAGKLPKASKAIAILLMADQKTKVGVTFTLK
jgi:hypothetical protein